jgi:putative hydrolase of the HAD superfamily
MGAIKKLITFDLDNTLWDVEPPLIKAEHAQREWLLEHRPAAMERYTDEEIWEFKKSVWKRHPQLSHHLSDMRIQMLYELQLAAGYGESDAREGAQHAFAIFMQHRQAVVFYDEALSVLRELAIHYRIGALTNGNADIYKTEAGEFFEFSLLSEHVGASKPAPDMFLAAMDATGAAAHEVIHVGDSPEHDVQGAQALGIRTVWMNSSGEDWAAGKPADREIDNLKQLPAAIASIFGANAK